MTPDSTRDTSAIRKSSRRKTDPLWNLSHYFQTSLFQSEPYFEGGCSSVPKKRSVYILKLNTQNLFLRFNLLIKRRELVLRIPSSITLLMIFVYVPGPLRTVRSSTTLRPLKSRTPMYVLSVHRSPSLYFVYKYLNFPFPSPSPRWLSTPVLTHLRPFLTMRSRWTLSGRVSVPVQTPRPSMNV